MAQAAHLVRGKFENEISKRMCDHISCTISGQTSPGYWGPFPVFYSKPRCAEASDCMRCSVCVPLHQVELLHSFYLDIGPKSLVVNLGTGKVAAKFLYSGVPVGQFVCRTSHNRPRCHGIVCDGHAVHDQNSPPYLLGGNWMMLFASCSSCSLARAENRSSGWIRRITIDMAIDEYMGM